MLKITVPNSEKKNTGLTRRAHGLLAWSVATLVPAIIVGLIGLSLSLIHI